VTPVRIQRRRVKGWRMPEGAVYVGRPSRWGNPFVVGETYMWIVGLAWPIPTWREPGVYDGLSTVRVERCRADQLVPWYREWITSISLRVPGLDPLRGRNLACWCPPVCGVDVDLGWNPVGSGPFDPCARPRGHDGYHDPSEPPYCHADVLLELANR
jgi:hypothetical protein